MILLNDFFTIRHLHSEPELITADIELNPQHKIFEGHFPGQPVVPGVCMMQVVKEVLEDALDISTNLAKALDLKFLLVINPLETKALQVKIKYTLPENNQYSLQAELVNGDKCFFKFKGSFVRQIELAERN
ncbi:3-hydroxyacyl-ACP dehydratase [Pinibacter soli]|uniref:3-hydroxyacyl-ACP dehydratase n=1 Tax=Pinibacter soli TaxID=3044211 RepID=A0ABT6RBY1_9BACT|nr:3-hydroxyacyl-ACP dehydratase [Pinibacter soli]MDI3320088.1 3-hydroxyacyl-ACP dehydratase [Pinibacter soli]